MKKLIQGEAIETLRSIESESVDLILTDPPYNINVKGERWDKFESESIYFDFLEKFFIESSRIIKSNGSLWIYHNQFPVLAKIHEIATRYNFAYNSFIIWDKGQYRSISWKTSTTKLRSFFNTCEYILYFNKASGAGKTEWDKTGMQRILSNKTCFAKINGWYKSELKRLNLTNKDVAKKYTEITRRKHYMVEHHYFCNSQFEMPNKTVWETVYKPLGFRREYEDLRREYEDLRYYFKPFDENNNNLWQYQYIHGSSNKRVDHPCQKPLEHARKIIRTCCRPDGIVLDPFAGSGTTLLAAEMEKRDYIGIELNKKYYALAQSRIEQYNRQSLLFLKGEKE